MATSLTFNTQLPFMVMIQLYFSFFANTQRDNTFNNIVVSHPISSKKRRNKK